ncbi:MAG: ferric reductase-like transmembrane domain-containing protein [Cohnella sp.]|nr:ferric reductase-like transmembrane domain-containing protein [Cohnella sp.]
MIDWFVDLPSWHLIRFFGFVSYLMLGIGISLGILYSWPNQQAKSKLLRYKLHTAFTIGGTALGLLHGVITVIDTYMPFAWSDVFIPFASEHEPVLNGLGTLAAYGLLVLVLTSDLRNKLKKKLWFAIHLLSYPIFAMAFVHGYFIGTDTSNPLLKGTYFASLLAVLGLTIARGMARRAPGRKPESAEGTGFPQR